MCCKYVFPGLLIFWICIWYFLSQKAFNFYAFKFINIFPYWYLGLGFCFKSAFPSSNVHSDFLLELFSFFCISTSDLFRIIFWYKSDVRIFHTPPTHTHTHHKNSQLFKHIYGTSPLSPLFSIDFNCHFVHELNSFMYLGLQLESIPLI